MTWRWTGLPSPCSVAGGRPLRLAFLAEANAAADVADFRLLHEASQFLLRGLTFELTGLTRLAGAGPVERWGAPSMGAM